MPVHADAHTLMLTPITKTPNLSNSLNNTKTPNTPKLKLNNTKSNPSSHNSTSPLEKCTKPNG